MPDSLDMPDIPCPTSHPRRHMPDIPCPLCGRERLAHSCCRRRTEPAQLKGGRIVRCRDCRHADRALGAAERPPEAKRPTDDRRTLPMWPSPRKPSPKQVGPRMPPPCRLSNRGFSNHCFANNRGKAGRTRQSVAAETACCRSLSMSSICLICGATDGYPKTRTRFA